MNKKGVSSLNIFFVFYILIGSFLFLWDQSTSGFFSILTILIWPYNIYLMFEDFVLSLIFITGILIAFLILSYFISKYISSEEIEQKLSLREKIKNWFAPFSSNSPAKINENLKSGVYRLSQNKPRI